MITLVLLENLNEMNFGRCGKMITSANGTAWFSKRSSAYEDLQILKQKEEKCKHHHCAFIFLASVLPNLSHICRKLWYLHAA